MLGEGLDIGYQREELPPTGYRQRRGGETFRFRGGDIDRGDGVRWFRFRRGDIDRGDGVWTVSISPRGYRQRRWTSSCFDFAEGISTEEIGWDGFDFAKGISTEEMESDGFDFAEGISTEEMGFRRFRFRREDLHREHAQRRFRFRRITAMAIESPTSSKQEEVENENTEHEFLFL